MGGGEGPPFRGVPSSVGANGASLVRCGRLEHDLIDFRFSDTAGGSPPFGSPVKVSPEKRMFQIAPVVPREYLSSRYDLKQELFYSKYTASRI